MYFGAIAYKSAYTMAANSSSYDPPLALTVISSISIGIAGIAAVWITLDIVLTSGVEVDDGYHVRFALSPAAFCSHSDICWAGYPFTW